MDQGQVPSIYKLETMCMPVTSEDDGSKLDDPSKGLDGDSENRNLVNLRNNRTK